MPRYLHRQGEGGLTRQQALAVTERLEWLESELGQAARYLDDMDEPRAAAFLLCACRDLLAAAHLVTPATEQDMTRLIEQLPAPPQNGYRSA
jgi:hypothetical protein